MTHLDTEGIKSVLISTSKSYICAFSLFNTIFFYKAPLSPSFLPEKSKSVDENISTFAPCSIAEVR